MGADIPVLVCKACGYSWLPRVPDPKVCPRCKSRSWEQDNQAGVKAGATQKEVKRQKI